MLAARDKSNMLKWYKENIIYNRKFLNYGTLDI